MTDKKKANNRICHCYSVICKYIHAFKNKKPCVSDKRLNEVISEAVVEMGICDICTSQCYYDDFGYCRIIECGDIIYYAESAKYIIEKNYILPKFCKDQTR